MDLITVIKNEGYIENGLHFFCYCHEIMCNRYCTKRLEKMFLQFNVSKLSKFTGKRAVLRVTTPIKKSPNIDCFDKQMGGREIR